MRYRINSPSVTSVLLPIRPAGSCRMPALVAVLCIMAAIVVTVAAQESKIDVRLASSTEIRELNQTGGKARLVNFWATWCGPCKEEFPELVALFRGFQPNGLNFVTVSADQKTDRKEVLEFLRKNEASGTNLLFDGTDLAGMLESFDSKWKAILPYTVLFDAQGKIVFRREGKIKKKDLRRALTKLLGPPEGS